MNNIRLKIGLLHAKKESACGRRILFKQVAHSLGISFIRFRQIINGLGAATKSQQEAISAYYGVKPESLWKPKKKKPHLVGQNTSTDVQH